MPSSDWLGIVRERFSRMSSRLELEPSTHCIPPEFDGSYDISYSNPLFLGLILGLAPFSKFFRVLM